MPSKPHKERKLAVILFADIAGYTAMMQSDEGNAMSRLRHYQAVLTDKVNLHKGEIVKNYGDGSLCLFPSVLGAVNCAKDLQENFLQEPQVPLRIGLHMGDVMYEANDIYGNAINVASRIESMGIPSSVLMSRDVYKKVRNQASLKFKDLGSFEFKNIEEPIQVYALTNKGLAIPEIDNISGKFQPPPDQSESSFFQKIWKRKIPQILMAYIALAWIGLQVFDWALLQFGISPHWAQIFFITVIGIIPPLLVYLNNREPIQQSRLKIGEKILFPTNFAIIGAVLYFMFSSADLGAVSKKVTFLNADGEEETHEIIKAEFKKQFPIFPFEPIDGKDSTDNWIGLTSPRYLGYFLNQDKYLTSAEYFLTVNRARRGEYYTTVEKINRSKIYNQNYYIDGEYQFKDGIYELIPSIRNKVNGNLIIEKRIVGMDFTTVIDSAVLFIRSAVGLSKSQMDESLVLGSREISSKYDNAIKEYCIGMSLGNFLTQCEKALEIDSTYVHPSIGLAIHFTTYSSGRLESKILIDRAIRHMKNLPFEEQISIRIQKHLIYEKWDKAEQLLRLQLEIDPDSEAYNFMLSYLYLQTFQIDKFITQAEKHYEQSPSLGTGGYAVQAALMKGQLETIINTIDAILKSNPQLIWALEYLTASYMHMEKYDLAEETINKIILIEPEVELNLSKSLDAIGYLKSQGNSQEVLSKFTGIFRWENSEMMLNNKMIGNNYYNKAQNQRGFFMYLAEDNKVKRGTSGKAFQTEILVNDREKVYASKVTESYGADDYVYYQWKQDSVIWNAENLLKQSNYDQAYDAYKKAISEDPEHYYLVEHLQHLVYLRTHSVEHIQQQLQRVAGNYSGAKFWIEDGLLYYKRPGLARRIFRPISDNRFITLSNYRSKYEFVKENNELVGVRVYNHDFETDEWNINPNWYFERTKFLD